MKSAQVYIHVPFCKRKCEYCDFLSAPMGEEARDAYVKRLIYEIKNSEWAQKGIFVPTVFLGGGTPSLLTGRQIKSIMDTLFTNFEVAEDCEITMEANPGTVTKESLKAYREAGINRLSIGLQSANNEELKALGRIHTYEEFLESYELAREEGFTNINVDLMSALPYQKIQTYRETLEKVCALKPEHISAYSLIVEEGTPFYEKYREDVARLERGEDPLVLPSEEEERLMYQDTEAYLKKWGYHRYEISNYAREGFECRHNKGYWMRYPYLGFGLGASGFTGSIRTKNTADFKEYMEKEIVPEREAIDTEAAIEEFMFLGLRMDVGISKEAFLREFHKSIEEVYGEVLSKLKEETLIFEKDDRIALTPYGRDVSNYVLAMFLR